MSKQKIKWGDDTSPSIIQIVKQMIQSANNRLVMDTSNIYWGKIKDIEGAVRLACLDLGCNEKKFNPAINVRGVKCEILLGNKDFMKN